jgi:hypothetical protein
MQTGWKKLTGVLLLFTTQCTWAADDLLPRTAQPDQPPYFSQIVEYEIVRENRIVRLMDYRLKVFRKGWYTDQRGYQYNGYWAFENHTKELSSRLKSEGSQAAPAERPLGKPLRPVRPENVPSQSAEALPLSVSIPRPPALLKKPPSVLTDVDWNKKSVKPDNALLPHLETAQQGVFLWQSNIRGRFNLCPVDEAEARSNGTEEHFYIPQIVASGRVWILRSELADLIYRYQEGGLDEEDGARRLVRLVRRFESLESQIWSLSQNGQAAYYTKLGEALPAIKKAGTAFNPYGDEQDKLWVARWMLIAQDTAVWLEREREVAPSVRGETRQSREILERALRKMEKSSPWHLRPDEQAALTKQIYRATQSIAGRYAQISDQYKESGNQDGYLDVIGWLGANENLRVYAHTLIQILEPQTK